MPEPVDFEAAREAVECTPRSGLPRLFGRMSTGGEVTIAYFGGSITAAPGWRVHSRARLEKGYPRARISEVNAAIGGTGSTLGVFRLERDVLAHAPDLVFVEFAVNDSGTESAEIIRNIEGIVRKVRRALPDAELCVIYTVAHESMLSELMEGRLPRAASVMEGVADHYSIPSINVGLEVARMAREKRLVFRGTRAGADAAIAAGGPLVFSEDGVHPFVDTGHVIYADVVERALGRIAESSPGPLPGPLPAPIATDNCESARLAPIDRSAPFSLAGDWSRIALDPYRGAEGEPNGPERAARGRMVGLWRAAPGATLSFAFTGTGVGFYDLLGPDCGRIAVSIDRGEALVRPRFDGYCTYHRLGGFLAASGLPEARHTVRFTVEAEPQEKRSILFERNRADFDANRSRYAGASWYVGDIMLIGALE